MSIVDLGTYLTDGQRVEAPAKLNLTLHITGKRADGYHLLDSEVVFANLCDVIIFRAYDGGGGDNNEDICQFDGEFAYQLTDMARDDNLIIKILRGLRDVLYIPPLYINVTKNIPSGAGLGGGTADAAALLRFFSAEISTQQIATLAQLIGGDGICCYHSQAGLMQGIGEIFTPHPQKIQAELTDMQCVILWPGQGLATKEIYRQYSIGNADADNQAVGKSYWQNIVAGRNDLQIPAIKLMPEINEMIDFLNGFNEDLARMSGSGSAVFGLFHEKIIDDVLQEMRQSLPEKWFMWQGCLRQSYPSPT